MTLRRLLPLLGAALLAALATGFFVQQARELPPIEAGGDAWGWIEAARTAMEAGKQPLPALADTRLWESEEAQRRARANREAAQAAQAAATAAQADPEPPREPVIAGPGWRFVGVIGDAAGARALMEVAGRYRRVPAGEVVIDGVRVVAVSATELVLEIEGEAARYRLFETLGEGS